MDKIMNKKIVIEPFEKLVRNSEYSKSDDFKKLSVLAQIISSFWKKCVIATSQPPSPPPHSLIFL